MPTIHRELFVQRGIKGSLYTVFFCISTGPLHTLCEAVVAGGELPITDAITAWAILTAYLFQFGHCFIQERSGYPLLMSISCFLRWMFAMVIAIALPLLAYYTLTYVWFPAASTLPEDIKEALSALVPAGLGALLFFGYPHATMTAMRGGSLYPAAGWF